MAKNFSQDDSRSKPSAAEYGLFVVLFACLIIAEFPTVSSKVKALFNAPSGTISTVKTN